MFKSVRYNNSNILMSAGGECRNPAVQFIYHVDVDLYFLLSLLHLIWLIFSFSVSRADFIAVFTNVYRSFGCHIISDIFVHSCLIPNKYFSMQGKSKPFFNCFSDNSKIQFY